MNGSFVFVREKVACNLGIHEEPWLDDPVHDDHTLVGEAGRLQRLEGRIALPDG
jgi:hypothetical protein